ncbi:MAG: hybrid sensor histidine kinase/response regulator [Phenylobacterium sp.]|nr:hybrid sensor histidine kinase/response regulator [Phenylobacterium sp.]
MSVVNKAPGGSGPIAPTGMEQSGAIFDRATRLAKALFGAAVAQISLIAPEGLWRSGTTAEPIVGAGAGIRLVMATGELHWIEDATKDPRFRDEPVVSGPPHLRFFAAAPIRLEDGDIPGVIWVAGVEPRAYDAALAERLTDLAAFVADEWARVRARRAREVARRDSDMAQRMVASIIESAPISLVMVDREMTIVSCSPRWKKTRFLEGQEVIGRSLYDLVPGVNDTWREAHGRCLAGETIRADRVPMVHANGATEWMQVELAPWHDASGDIGGLIITSFDVTEMVEALERTERSEERLKLAMEIAELHVWELDYRRHELIKVGAEDSFFTEPKTYEELAADIWSTLDPRDIPRVRAEWERHATEGAPYHPEYRVVRSDDKEIWVQGAVRYLTDPAGKPLRLIGAIQNITDRKTSERALVKAKEEAEAATLAKSAFLATMSHEIRTPLNGVLGMAQAMAMSELTDQQRERLDVVRQSGEALLSILNDVLDLSKIEAGKLELDAAENDIGELASSAHATFAATAEAKGLTFDLSVQAGARGVYLGDPVRVRQILYNLVSNALKFTDKGKVKVTVSRVAGKLVLTVKDTGIGIAPEQLSTLFQKFEQADASTTRRFGGTGLGLSICRDLAEMMGGRIDVESAPGAGATFRAELPLTRVSSQPAAPASVVTEPAVPSEGRPIRVLAAEDNGMNQLVLKTLLNQVGVDPVIVADGRAAVLAWEKEPWDLILMDVQMPVMDGPTATGVIRAREKAEGRARTPIVALTANAMAHQVLEYKSAGMDDFVAKPIEASRLYTVVQAALDAAHDSQAAAAA